MRIRNVLRCSVASLALLQFDVGEVLAQASSGPSLAVEEIIVTTRLREENLQDIPLSITAFNTSSLAASGASSMTDISNMTLGLNFESYAGGGFPAPTIRGLAPTSILAFETNVAFFYGGIYLPKSYMIDAGLAGIERVEVVKGPQSALYGRNAFSGAINYVPIAPPDELLVDAFVTGGSDKRFDIGATVGAPIVEDRASFVAGFTHSEFGGTWTNNHPEADVGSGTKGNLGGYDNDTYFAALTFTPTDRFELTVGYTRWEKDHEQQGKYGIRRNNGGSNCSVGSDGVLQFFCGTFEGFYSATIDPRGTGLVGSTDLFRAEATYDISDNMSLSYRYGYVDSDAVQFDPVETDQINGDNTVLGSRFVVFPLGSIKGPSHDVRFEYDEEDTYVSFGAYYQNLSDSNELWVTFPDRFLATKPGPGSQAFTADDFGAGLNIPVTNQQTKVRNRSVFAQVSQDFSDGQFNISAEARYTEEKKIQDDLRAARIDEEKFTFFTPRIAATWNFSDSSIFYVSAAKGVKSGGFNGGGLPAERPFQPEENWTYELGTKNVFADGQFIFNAALFHIDWSNLQTLGQSADPAFIGTITRNIGAASSQGFEAEFTAFVTEGFQINGGIALNDATRGEGEIDPSFLIIRNASNVFIDACDDVVCPSDGSIGGNDLVRQSKFHATGGIRYDGDFTMVDDGQFWIGAQVNHKSKQFLDNMNLTRIPPRTLVNLQAGISKGNISLEGWVRNLFDKKYVSSSLFNLSPPREIKYTPTFGERVTMGLTLRYRM